MDSIVIRGGNPLIGDVHISGSKNASLPIMASCLLTSEPCYLENLPNLSDIKTMQLLLLNHGADVSSPDANSNVTRIRAHNINNLEAPYDIVRKMRASIWSLGPLLTRYGAAKVSLPGGCAIGARQVDLHISSLKAMGASFVVKEGYIYASSEGRLRGAEYTFPKKSVGATINAIMAATLADGETILHNAAIEPEITDLCNFLVTIGANISSIGKNSVHIIGTKELHGGTYKVMPDRIEAGTYMIASALTNGNINIHGIGKNLLSNLIPFLNKAGASVSYIKKKQLVSQMAAEASTELATQGIDEYINIKRDSNIKSVDIATGPYPEFSTDLQAQFLTLMTIADGTSYINENIFENRFMHVPELCRMGADISMSNNIAKVIGVPELKGANVMASDLRASVSLVIAGLAAQGETKILRVYHLDRGYETLEKKLQACGAEIQRVKE